MKKINTKNLTSLAMLETPRPAWILMLIVTVTASWITLHVVGIDDRLVSYTLLEVLRILTRS